MGVSAGLIAIVAALALLWLGRPPRGSDIRPIFQSWLMLVGFETLVMLLLVGGVAAVITNWS